MSDAGLSGLLAAAVVSAAAAFGVEWLAKPRLEVRKERGRGNWAFEARGEMTPQACRAKHGEAHDAHMTLNNECRGVVRAGCGSMARPTAQPCAKSLPGWAWARGRCFRDVGLDSAGRARDQHCDDHRHHNESEDQGKQ